MRANKQIELRNGLPFDLRLPTPSVPNMATMTDEEIDAEIAKGYEAARAGRVRSVSEARAAFEREFAR